MKLLLVAAAIASAAMAAPAANSANGDQMLVEAMDFMARASSTSEVLTLNLTNLLILLVLKALIFGFGLFSFGNTGAAAGAAAAGLNARSYDSDEVAFGISGADVTGGLCFLNYMSGNEAKFDCIRRSACEDPKTGADYLNAAKMWYKMHALVNAIPFHDTYYNVVEGLEESISHAGNGGDCSVYQW